MAELALSCGTQTCMKLAQPSLGSQSKAVLERGPRTHHLSYTPVLVGFESYSFCANYNCVLFFGKEYQNDAKQLSETYRVSYGGN